MSDNFTALSRISEKCSKCDKKDTCHTKRMELCGMLLPQYETGGIPNNASGMIATSGRNNLQLSMNCVNVNIGVESNIKTIRDAIMRINK